MRRIALVLTVAAIFSLGATSTTDCLSALLPIFTPSVGITIHVVNDAYYPVTAQLVTTTAATASAADQTAVSATTANDEDSSDTEDEETSDTTNDDSSDTQAGRIDPGEETKIATVLCATTPGPIALKATVKDDSGTEFSATSSKLYYGTHYSCGDRINFIVRPAARVGIVVGYEVIPGKADLDVSDE